MSYFLHVNYFQHSVVVIRKTYSSCSWWFYEDHIFYHFVRNWNHLISEFYSTRPAHLLDSLMWLALHYYYLCGCIIVLFTLLCSSSSDWYSFVNMLIIFVEIYSSFKMFLESFHFLSNRLLPSWSLPQPSWSLLPSSQQEFLISLSFLVLPAPGILTHNKLIANKYQVLRPPMINFNKSE